MAKQPKGSDAQTKQADVEPTADALQEFKDEAFRISTLSAQFITAAPGTTTIEQGIDLAMDLYSQVSSRLMYRKLQDLRGVKSAESRKTIEELAEQAQASPLGENPFGTVTKLGTLEKKARELFNQILPRAAAKAQRADGRVFEIAYAPRKWKDIKATGLNSFEQHFLHIFCASGKNMGEEGVYNYVRKIILGVDLGVMGVNPEHLLPDAAPADVETESAEPLQQEGSGNINSQSD